MTQPKFQPGSKVTLSDASKSAELKWANNQIEADAAEPNPFVYLIENYDGQVCWVSESFLQAIA